MFTLYTCLHFVVSYSNFAAFPTLVYSQRAIIRRDLADTRVMSDFHSFTSEIFSHDTGYFIDCVVEETGD